MNIDAIRERARIVGAVRRFFDAKGFVEVETDVRIAAPAPEEHIDCPPVAGGGYLRASPELQMKKLLAGGMDLIYQIGPCFREGESGDRHRPEFTMLEWYRRGADYMETRKDLEELVESLGLCGSFRTLRVREAYVAYAGWDPWSGEWDGDRFDFDMAGRIEPAIAELGGGVFLSDYPVEAASLSKVSSSGGERYAERWEFYWNGMELANAFSELCDGGEQRLRFERARKARMALGEADYPVDEEFLAAIDGIGSASGVALGVDRLVMALLGLGRMSQVRA